MYSLNIVKLPSKRLYHSASPPTMHENACCLTAPPIQSTVKFLNFCQADEKWYLSEAVIYVSLSRVKLNIFSLVYTSSGKLSMFLAQFSTELQVFFPRFLKFPIK